jgi:aldehyde dehydrogenase (NAD+)
MAAWKLAPALAMGNTVVLKPAPATSFTAIRLFEILHEAAIFPEGVINLVLGGPAVGEALTRHPGVNKVAFTGSTAVGRQVVHGSADSNLKTLSLELGGKSANIVFDDAPEVDFAIERSFTAMFSHKGEKCSEPTRLFVQEKLYRRFVDEFAARADKVVCGDPFLPGSQQGPQCTLEQFEKALRYIEIGKKEGARLVSGGTADRSPGNEKGYYVRPTVFADVGNRMRIAQEEIFGPVLVILPFRTEDEAVAMANDSPYGLAAGLWSADVSRAHRVAARLEAGMVFVNRYGCYDFSAPFGGWKQSGWGKEMALHSLDAYTRLKSVWIKI